MPISLAFMCVYFHNILKDSFDVFSHVFEKETFDLSLERIIYFFLNSINILKLSILFNIFIGKGDNFLISWIVYREYLEFFRLLNILFFIFLYLKHFYISHTFSALSYFIKTNSYELGSRNKKKILVLYTLIFIRNLWRWIFLKTSQNYDVIVLLTFILLIRICGWNWFWLLSR